MTSGKKTKSVGATILTVIVAVLIVVLRGGEGEGSGGGPDRVPSGGAEQRSGRAPGVAVEEGEVGEALIEGLFREERSDAQVEIRARVSRVLPDDDEGDRHQRFIVRFEESGQTVLISHNIDLAPRVPVEEGDWVGVVGEYEWSDRGGVIHWTHHNPARNPIHPPGWVEHGGVRYE